MGLSGSLADSHRSQSSRASTNISKSSEASESRGPRAGALPGPWPSASRSPGLRAPSGAVTSSSGLVIPGQWPRPQPLLPPRAPALLRDGRLDRSGLCPARAGDGWASQPRLPTSPGWLPAAVSPYPRSVNTPTPNPPHSTTTTAATIGLFLSLSSGPGNFP